MQFNVDRLKAERQKRAWSQEQLAAAAGLGLRTIQRIESSGIASNETIRSLAAVFECTTQDLTQTHQKSERSWFRKRAGAIAASASAALISVVLLATHAAAREVMLEVVLGGATPDVKVFRLVTAEGHQAEARVDGQLRVVFTPTFQQNDLILLTAEIYAYEGQDYRLLSTPKVLTRDGVDAKFEIGGEGGKNFQVNVTPKRI